MRFLIPLLLPTLLLAQPNPGSGPFPTSPGSITNIVTAVTSGAGVPTLLQYPHVGLGQGLNVWDGLGATGTEIDWHYQWGNNGLSQLSNAIPFYVGAGTSGIVRTIAYEIGGTGLFQYTNRLNQRLRLYVDGGTITNFTNLPSGNLAADIPISVLIGDKWQTNDTVFSNIRYSRWLDSVEGTNSSLGQKILHFKLSLPVPFTNGCAIQLYDAKTNGPTAYGYFSCGYELGALPLPWSTWRLRCSWFSTNTVVGYTHPSNILTSVAGPGLLVGMMQSVHDTNATPQDTIFESPIVFQTGANTNFIWKSSGGDDLFINSYSFSNAKRTFGYDEGTMVYTNSVDGAGNPQPYSIESYRWFSDDSIYWTNSMKTWFNASADASAYDLLLLYYAP